MEENTTPSYQQLVKSQPLLPLLQCAVYMVSNALLPQKKLDDMVEWVESSGHSKVLGSFVKAKGLSIEAFASNVLVSATRVGSLAVASALLEVGVSPDCKDYACLQPYPTVLEKAIQMQNISLARLFLHYGANPNGASSSSFLSPIGPLLKLWTRHWQLRDKSSWMRIIEIVEVLLDAGATIKDSEFRFILHENIPFTQKVSLSKLADSVCRRGGVDGVWSTELDVKLQDAVAAGNIRTVRQLVQEGADVNCWRHRPDMVLPKPLARAVSQGNINMVRTLLDLGANPNGTLSQVEFSCPALIEPNWQRDRVYLFGALHKAVQDSNAALAEMLLQHGADASSIDLYGNIPLQYAINSKSLELIAILLSHGADANNFMQAVAGDSLHLAAEEPILELLLHHGLRVSLPPQFHNSMFYAAVAQNKPDLLRMLLRAYRNNSRLISEQGAIDSAMNEMEDDKAREFFDNLLATAFFRQSLECIHCLTGEMGDMVQARGIVLLYDDDIELEYRDKQLAFVLDLVDNGADINDYNESRDTQPFLQAAIRLQDFALVTFLLSRGAKVTRDSQPKDFSPLHLTMKSQNPAFVLENSKALVRYGADIHAYETMKFKVYQSLIPSRVRGASVYGGQVKFDSLMVDVTPVQLAAARGNHRAINWLLQEGADLNAPAAKDIGFTALQLAILYNQKDAFVQHLINAGADINVPAASKEGYTALQAAIATGQDELASRLIHLGANINALPGSEVGLTALQAAALSDSEPLVFQLLAAGAEVNAPAASQNGRTALQAASFNTNMKIVEALLARGADVNAPPGQMAGATALQFASMRGHLDLVMKLLKAGADINAPAAVDDGRTALQGAAENGRLDTVHLLLQNDPDALSDGGKLENAAKFAEERGHTAIVKLLRGWDDPFSPHSPLYVLRDFGAAEEDVQ